MKQQEKTDIQMEKELKGRSLSQDAWRRFRRNKLAMLGVITLLTIFTVAVLTPILSPWQYGENLYNKASFSQLMGEDLGNYEPFLEAKFPRKPSFSDKIILGTDNSDADIFLKVMVGAIISLAVGFTASLVAVIIGVGYGAISGFFGGRVDQIMMRFVDILYAVPFMFIVIVLLTFFDSNFLLLFIAIGCIEWLSMARIVRGQTLSIKNKEYIDAARTTGVNNFKIIFKHIIPNLLGVVVVYTTLLIPQTIMTESFLSFLGLGVTQLGSITNIASLGTLISEATTSMKSSPHVLIFPALFLSIIILCFNFIGDGLRDAFDPKDR